MTPAGPHRHFNRSSDSPESKAEPTDPGRHSHQSLRISSSPIPSGPLDPRLLSPPTSEKNFDLPPFKPSDSDATSLSMLSSRSRQGKKKRPPVKEHASSADAKLSTHASDHSLGRRSSLPNMNQVSSVEAESSPSADQSTRHGFGRTYSDSKRSISSQESSSRGRRDSRAGSRRWTLPSKTRTIPTLSDPKQPPTAKAGVSRPAQGVAMVSEQKDATNQSPEQQKPQEEDPLQNLFSSLRRMSTFTPDTPAMITLRRATAGRQTRIGSSDSTLTVKAWNGGSSRRSSTRPMERLLGQILTFCSTNFPHVAARSRDSTNTSPTESPGKVSSENTPSPSRKRSTISKFHNGDCTLASAAEPAITHVEFSCTFPARGENLSTNVQRRTSTKVCTGLNIHEIIWEDDDGFARTSKTSSSSRSSRSLSQSFKITYTRSRRQSSTAIEALDATLKKANNGARRSSGSPNEYPGSRRHSKAKEMSQKRKRKTISSLFGRDWSSNLHQDFLPAPSDTQGLLDPHDQEEIDGQYGDENNARSALHPTEVFFFPPLPTREESGFWKLPTADIHSKMSGVSTFSEEGSSMLRMSSTSAGRRPSCPPNSCYSAQDKSESRYDSRQQSIFRQFSGERASSLNSISTPLLPQTGTKLGISSRSRRASRDIRPPPPPGRSRTDSTVLSESQSPARGSVSKFLLDGGYSSADATTVPRHRPSPPPGNGKRRRRGGTFRDVDGEGFSPNGTGQGGPSVQEFVEKIEKLTADGGRLLRSKSEKDRSIASWAEGLPMSFTARSGSGSGGRSSRGLSRARTGTGEGFFGRLGDVSEESRREYSQG